MAVGGHLLIENLYPEDINPVVYLSGSDIIDYFNLKPKTETKTDGMTGTKRFVEMEYEEGEDGWLLWHFLDSIPKQEGETNLDRFPLHTTITNIQYKDSIVFVHIVFNKKSRLIKVRYGSKVEIRFAGLDDNYLDVSSDLFLNLIEPALVERYSRSFGELESSDGTTFNGCYCGESHI